MRSQERFGLEDVRKNNDESLEHRHHGIVVSRLVVFITISIFLFLLCASVLITYNFGICSNINVESEVCDKKNVIPIKISINSSQSSDESKRVPFEEDLHLHNRTNIRLPKTMHPIAYELKLIPFLFEGNFTFNGEVRIKVLVTRSSQNITLHAMALKIHEVSVWKLGRTQSKESKSKIEVAKKYAFEPDQLFVIITAAELEPSNYYEINIKYTGVLNDMLQGFYRSSYVVNNVTR